VDAGSFLECKTGLNGSEFGAGRLRRLLGVEALAVGVQVVPDPVT